MVSEYKKQSEAFAACLENQFTYAVNYRDSKACYFVNATEKQFWDKYMVSGPRNNYEKIRADRPCYLYLDLDKTDQYPNVDLEDIYQIIQRQIKNNLEAFGVKEIRFIKLHSHSKKKQSLHIIVKTSALFKNLEHCGEFVRAIKEDSEFPDVIDTSVYSKNRNFRMLGCTKAGQERYMEGDKPLTYEFWRDTKIQPLNWDGDLIVMDINEKKEGVIVLDVPENVQQFFVQLAKDPKILKMVGPLNLNRIVCFPNEQVYIVNPEKNKCPFANRYHSKNHCMIYINLMHNKYGLKCYSPKCEGKEILYKTRDFLTEKVCI